MFDLTYRYIYVTTIRVYSSSMVTRRSSLFAVDWIGLDRKDKGEANMIIGYDDNDRDIRGD